MDLCYREKTIATPDKRPNRPCGYWIVYVRLAAFHEIIAIPRSTHLGLE
jgi:hypothetical protein